MESASKGARQMDAKQELALFPRFTTVVFSVEHRHLNTSDHQHVAGSEHARDWHGEDYLVLFDESEAAAVSERFKSCDCCLGSKFWGCDAGMISLYETQPVRLIRFLLFLLTRYTFIVFCPRRKNCLAT